MARGRLGRRLGGREGVEDVDGGLCGHVVEEQPDVEVLLGEGWGGREEKLGRWGGGG